MTTPNDPLRDKIATIGTVIVVTVIAFPIVGVLLMLGWRTIRWAAGGGF